MVVKKLLDEFSEDVIRAFVQKNSDYYLVKWKLMANSGSKISWNWASFLFGIFWMVYRKMFLYFIIVLVISYIVGYITSSISSIINLIFMLAICLAFGLLGNYGYAYFVYNKLQELKLIAKSEEELRMLALQKGGVSVVAVIISIAIIFLLELIVIGLAVSSSSYYY